MYDSPKFWARHGTDDFAAISEPGNPSSAYMVASVAKRRIEQGEKLQLPEGYDLDMLERISWILGTYDVQQVVDRRQAFELACIGRELLAAHATTPFLSHLEERAVEQLVTAALQQQD